MEKAKHYCKLMLEAREYEITEENDDAMIAVKPDGNNVVVFYSISGKLDNRGVRFYMTAMEELEIDHAIVVYNGVITPPTYKSIEQQAMNLTFELFHQDDLQYDITEHEYQPLFEKVDPERTQEIFTNWGKRWPVLRHAGPIARYYAYNKGDLIKVTRDNGQVIFRIVK